jgi:hypothetical protein
MKIKYKDISIITALILALVSTAVLADQYAYTQVYFNIPSDISFKISLPGDAASPYTSSATSPPTTAWISFNTSTLPANGVQPWTLGVNDVSHRQNGPSYPIFYVENAGNTIIDFNITIASLDSCLTLCANATCGNAGCGGATFTGTCTNINGIEAKMVDNLPYIDGFDHVNITLYANFAGSCTVGQKGPYQITHKSTAG